MLLICYGFHQLIDIPTRTTETTISLIDLFYINNPDNVLEDEISNMVLLHQIRECFTISAKYFRETTQQWAGEPTRKYFADIVKHSLIWCNKTIFEISSSKTWDKLHIAVFSIYLLKPDNVICHGTFPRIADHDGTMASFNI